MFIVLIKNSNPILIFVFLVRNMNLGSIVLFRFFRKKCYKNMKEHTFVIDKLHLKSIVTLNFSFLIFYLHFAKQVIK